MPTRILTMLVVLIVLFGAVLLWSVRQHRQTARSLQLLHAGYLPLTLTVGEAKATQSLFGTVVDRLLSEPDPTASRRWLEVAAKVRPAALTRAFSQIEEIRRLDPPTIDRTFLAELAHTLRRVQTRYVATSGRYRAFFAALKGGESAEAARRLSTLRSEERQTEQDLRTLRRALEERIATLSAVAATREREAALLLLALALVTVLVGALLLWLTHRLLAPLPRLHRRVGAVALGNLSPVALPVSNDEFGDLARAFENMVEALRERNRQLIRSERLAAIGKMAAHVTHEVRNPLSSIGLNIDLLQDEVGTREEARTLLGSIQRELDRLTRVTDEYLRLARLPHPEKEVGDLRAVVESLVKFLQPEMTQNHTEVALTVRSPLPMISFDEGQLRQALLNLLRNAREAMPDGGTVTLGLSSFDDGVLFRIDDEGVGMTADVREKIFDLFFTTKSGGSGLGLALTHQIIVAHGGRIRCEAREQGGTRFDLWLPASLAPDRPAAERGSGGDSG